MSVVIFGNGPLPVEANFPVMAPGSRTWQIVRTVAAALAEQGKTGEDVIVYGLDEQPRSNGVAMPLLTTIKAGSAEIRLSYHALPYEQFSQLGSAESASVELPADVRAVIGTGSVQPYSTAARFAGAQNLPLWIDVFGDPLCEIQSQAELSEDPANTENATRQVHIWKLFVDALLYGDKFSALSDRQRYALLGQLGCAGRLNQHTAAASLVDAIPYSLFLEDYKPVTPTPHGDGRFTVMWSGSFNTWMDVPTLTRGLTTALQSTPNMRLLVVGGKIPGYNEISYGQFLDGIKAAGVEGAVTLMDWQPLSAMEKLYAEVDLGISIDRYTYEAELGSRTRLVNFLAAGVPVASTVVTELSQQLKDAGHLQPFELGNAESLTEALIRASADRGDRLEKAKASIKHIYTAYNGNEQGKPLKNWLRSPTRAADKDNHHTNMLVKHVARLRESLGA